LTKIKVNLKQEYSALVDDCCLAASDVARKVEKFVVGILNRANHVV
jgi:hypothetical protein